MGAVRAHVGDHRREVRCKFTLHVEVPLLHVIARWLGFNKVKPQSVRSQQRKRPRKKRPWGQLFANGALLVKGSTAEYPEIELVWQRQHVENAKASTNCGLAVVEWIPGETHPRFEIPKGWVLEKRRSQMGRWIGDVI